MSASVRGGRNEVVMTWHTIRTVLLSAAGGAMVWWIALGAVWGWMPPGNAEQQAAARVEAAVLQALVPICVTQFTQDGDREHKREALEKTSSHRRGSYVVEQGWATMPGTDGPETRIAGECACRILATSSL